MAAIQQLQASVTAKLNEEQKAAMEKHIENVKDGAATSEDTKKQGLIRTPCYFINRHKVEDTPMRLIYFKNWVGDANPETPIPKIVDWNHDVIVGWFIHEGQDGSAAGFVYGDGDVDDTDARKWTVAFDRKQNKAYAEAGPMGPVDWEAVKFKLDNLSGPYCRHVDPVFNGIAIAGISEEYNNFTAALRE